MKTSYLIAHLLAQTSLLTLGLFFLPFFGFLVTGTIFSSVGLLAALTGARMIVFVLQTVVLKQKRGYGTDLLSMLLTSTLTLLVLAFSGLGTFDELSWIIVFVLLMTTYVFAHGILMAAGARPGGTKQDD